MKVTGKSWANKNLIWAEKLGPQAFVPASPTSAICLTVDLIDPWERSVLFCFNFSFDPVKIGAEENNISHFMDRSSIDWASSNSPKSWIKRPEKNKDFSIQYTQQCTTCPAMHKYSLDDRGSLQTLRNRTAVWCRLVFYFGEGGIILQHRELRKLGLVIQS